jgi:beta-phosphoglucomutase
MFDFNGTLSHDEPVLCAIYREMFARHGRPLTEEVYFADLAGLSDQAIIGSWLDVTGPELAGLVSERVERYAATADGATVPGPVRAAVRHAAALVPVAIVSAAFRAEIEPVVAAAGLSDEVTTIVAADDVVAVKPSPAGYLLALTRLGIGPDESVAFEDTETGVAAAKAAGLRCIGVRGTMPDERLARADEIVDAIDVPLVARVLAR